MQTKTAYFLLFSCLLSTTIAHDDEELTIETEPDYTSPEPLSPQKVYFAEHFDNPVQFDKKWIKSQAKKEDILEEDIAKYDGEWELEPPQKDALKGDMGLVLKSKAKHAAISASLARPFVFADKPFIVQYEVLLQEGQECGGAYLKLLTGVKDLKQFKDSTPYSIMFGPDKCGTDHKLHFIFKHKNPKNGTIEEKHCERPQERFEETFNDKLPHLYTLILRPDNTFDIQVDRKSVKTGSLLEDFTPSVNPPAEIEDPQDKKPEDWDEREKIPDPTASKPEDWDEDAPAQIVDESSTIPDGWLEQEPSHIPDNTAVKPVDWDEDMDGEWEPPLLENPKCADAPGCGLWEPPLINNPAFKGKWRAPLIDNPNYKGKWRARKIANPDYFEDKQPFKMQQIEAVGFELWSMSSQILFDNLIITDDVEVAEHYAAVTFDKKRQNIAKTSESVVQKLANLTNEYPILWALYILALGVPVAFILYLLCRPASNREAEEQKQEADHKKTDASTQEDPVEEAQITELEEPEENNEDEDAEKNSSPDSEEDQEEMSEEQQDGTRKRKVRKD